MKLPKILYVYVDVDGEDEYLIANDNLKDCADKNEMRLVGVYELKETKKVVLEVTEEVIEK